MAAQASTESAAPATVFRKWGAPHSSAQRAVPELERVFLCAGLSSHLSAADAWCEDMGAAFLGEVLENVDEFCAHLGSPGPKALSAAELQRLRSELFAAELPKPHLGGRGDFPGQTKSAQGRLAPWGAPSPSTPAAAWGGGLPETKTTATKTETAAAPPQARRW